MSSAWDTSNPPTKHNNSSTRVVLGVLLCRSLYWEVWCWDVGQFCLSSRDSNVARWANEAFLEGAFSVHGIWRDYVLVWIFHSNTKQATCMARASHTNYWLLGMVNLRMWGVAGHHAAVKVGGTFSNSLISRLKILLEWKFSNKTSGLPCPQNWRDSVAWRDAFLIRQLRC